VILTRTGEIVRYRHEGEIVEGLRGLLVIGPVAFETIERGGDCLRLLPDRYTCEFGWWTSGSGKRAKAIRVLLTEEQFRAVYPESERERVVRLVGPVRARGRVYLHPANYPHELAGCVAPGLNQIENGVGRSQIALNRIFEALGGWREGVRLPYELEVA
jgi:hypothetical protein